MLDLEMQSNGKVLACGSITQFGGMTLTGRSVRLNMDGTRDPGFAPPIFGLASINSIALRPDEGIVLGGAMGIASPLQSRVRQLNPDGSLDATFTTGLGPNAFIRHVAVRSNGLVALAGGFTAYDGTPGAGLCVVNTNGSIVTGFDLGTGTNALPEVLVAATDAGVNLGGSFTTYQSDPAPRFIRILSTGLPDPAFNIGSGPSATVLAVRT